MQIWLDVSQVANWPYHLTALPHTNTLFQVISRRSVRDGAQGPIAVAIKAVEIKPKANR